MARQYAAQVPKPMIFCAFIVCLSLLELLLNTNYLIRDIPDLAAANQGGDNARFHSCAIAVSSGSCFESAPSMHRAIYAVCKVADIGTGLWPTLKVDPHERG